LDKKDKSTAPTRKGVRRMAVSMREYPIIKGKDAEKFLAEKRKTEELLVRIAEKYKRDPHSVKVVKRSRGRSLCNMK